MELQRGQGKKKARNSQEQPEEAESASASSSAKKTLGSVSASGSASRRSSVPARVATQYRGRDELYASMAKTASAQSVKKRNEAAKTAEDGASGHLRDGWTSDMSELPTFAAKFFVTVELYSLGVDAPETVCPTMWKMLHDGRLYPHNKDRLMFVCYRELIKVQQEALHVKSEPVSDEDADAAAERKKEELKAWRVGVQRLRCDWCAHCAFLIFLGGNALAQTVEFVSCEHDWQKLYDAAMKVWRDDGEVLSSYGGQSKATVRNSLRTCGESAAAATIWRQIESVKCVARRAEQIVDKIDHAHSIEQTFDYLCTLQGLKAAGYTWKIYAHLLLQSPTCVVPQRGRVSGYQACVDADTWCYVGPDPALALMKAYGELESRSYEHEQELFVQVCLQVYRKKVSPESYS
jgi:hypothetical protein